MKAPMGRGGERPASGSLVHSTDLGRAPEEMVEPGVLEGINISRVSTTPWNKLMKFVCSVRPRMK